MSLIDSLLEERRGYEVRGLPDRVAQVDAAIAAEKKRLKASAAGPVVETAAEAPVVETAATPPAGEPKMTRAEKAAAAKAAKAAAAEAAAAEAPAPEAS